MLLMAHFKKHRFIWDAMHDYDKIEWQWSLLNLEDALDVAYQDILNKFDAIWRSQSSL
jgi:hypothetical protein